MHAHQIDRPKPTAATLGALRGASRPGRMVTLLLATALACSAAACAPEPGEEAGSIDKETQTISPETEWGGIDQSYEEMQTTLPQSFPSAEFVIPSDAVIKDTGEKGPDTWFLVLEASSSEQGQAQWDAVVSASSFVVEDPVDTSEGGTAATLNSASLTVQAITIPQTDGTVLLSYDIQRVVQ